jgi:hypothetical protein
MQRIYKALTTLCLILTITFPILGGEISTGKNKDGTNGTNNIPSLRANSATGNEDVAPVEKPEESYLEAWVNYILRLLGLL